MANKAVFLDRDGMLMDNSAPAPKPETVKLLPGVELALNSLAQAGFQIVVATHQPAVARGLIDEETLWAVHGELQSQLQEKGSDLDAVYYCPHDPKGTVAKYARECEDRKPNPGLLLRAAQEMEIDLSESWVVADKSPDIEAGQRAGCRTIRIRSGSRSFATQTLTQDEDVQADFTVRSLAEAARRIVREPARSVLIAEHERMAASQGPMTPPASAAPVEPAPSIAPVEVEPPPAQTHSAPLAPPPSADPVEPMAGPRTRDVDEQPGSVRQIIAGMTDSEVLREMLQHARQISRMHHHQEFSVTRLAGGIFQVLAGLSLVMMLMKFASLGLPMNDQNEFWLAMAWIGVTAVLQLFALTFFLVARQD